MCPEIENVKGVKFVPKTISKKNKKTTKKSQAKEDKKKYKVSELAEELGFDVSYIYKLLKKRNIKWNSGMTFEEYQSIKNIILDKKFEVQTDAPKLKFNYKKEIDRKSILRDLKNDYRRSRSVIDTYIAMAGNDYIMFERNAKKIRDEQKTFNSIVKQMIELLPKEEGVPKQQTLMDFINDEDD